MSSEHDLQNGILDYLHLKKIYCWRNNSGAFKKDNYFIRFGKKGSADILGILPDGRFLAIECKAKGKYPTPEQEEFLQAIKQNNGVAILARSLDDVLRFIPPTFK